METWKKAGNIIGIVFAWILSIVLVFMLIVAPVVLSALSLLNTDTILDVLTGTLTQSIAPPNDETAADYSVTTLSETSDNVTADAAGNVLSQFLGQDVSPEVLEQILSSNAVKELLDAYTSDVVNAFSGSGKDAKFNAELIQRIVDENIDEIVQIAQEIAPEGTQINVEELKSQITGVVSEQAEEIVQALPKPEDIKEQLVQQTPEIEIAFQILASVGTIKVIIVAVIVVISGLIFLCRLPGFRGFRWLATDLFVGSGFGILISAAFGIVRTAVIAMIPSQEMLGGLAESLLSKMSAGLWIRTGVMLLCAVALLVAYIFVKKALAKKTAAAEEAVAEVVEEVEEEPEQLCESAEAEETAETVEAE